MLVVGGGIVVAVAATSGSERWRQQAASGGGDDSDGGSFFICLETVSSFLPTKNDDVQLLLRQVQVGCAVSVCKSLSVSWPTN